MKMKKQTTRVLLSFIVLVVSLMAFHAKVSAAVVGTSVADGVDYSPVYNYEYYIQHNPDVAKAYNGDDVATLKHFIEYGMGEGRQASASFDEQSYYFEYPDLRRAYGTNRKDYYLHYINYGKNEGRKATGVTQLVGTTFADGVDYSSVYNYEYYRQHNPDVANAYKDNDVDVKTLNHFIEYGMGEGRQASESFDEQSYYFEYPDLRRAYGVNDKKAYYLHYINYGKSEGRKATGVTQLVGTTFANGVDYSSVYNYEYYIQHNPDVAKAYNGDDVATLNHFIEYGMGEGRQASESFDEQSYYFEYPDLRRAYGVNDKKAYYLHYINYGKSEGRKATGVTQLVATTIADGVDYSPVYNYEYYRQHNPDVANAYKDNDVDVDVKTLNHFIEYGMTEGRLASDDFNVGYYRANYPDLQQAYGSNTSMYYLDYLHHGKAEERNGKSLWPDFTGWCTVRTDTYYYNQGTCYTGLHKIDGKEYFFSDSGILLSSGNGIDVSEHQGAIDWQKVKNGGISFAIIRIGIGSDGDPTQDDSTAAYNISECERLGIPYGVYLYSYALDDNEARSEVSHILRMLGGKHPPLGVYLDVEDTTYYNKYGHDPFSDFRSELNRICQIEMDTLKSAGYGGQTGIYTNLNYLRNVLESSLFTDNKLWLAQYYSSNSSPCVIWQYTSTGTVAGISGNVDLDIFFTN